MPTPGTNSSPSLRPIRSVIRDTVEAAWQAAVQAGYLPAHPGRGRYAGRGGDPHVRCRPRRRREQPRAEAGATAPAPRRWSSPRRSPRRSRPDRCGWPTSEVAVAAPGFLNLRLATGFLEQTLDAARAAGDDFGHVQAAPPRAINVEFVSANPTGPLHSRQRARRLRRRPAVPRAGGRRPSRHARVLLQRLRAPGPRAWCIGRGPARAASRCPRTAIEGAYVADLAAELPDEVWAAATGPTAPMPTAIVGAWASERVRAGIEAQPGAPRRPLRRLEERGSLHDEGWVERAVERLRASAAMSTSRTARRGSARPTSATTRTASSTAPTASRPTSRPTSATSPRSSAAASTTSSTSGAPTTTARSPASATPPRPWASTARRSRCCSIAWVRFVRDGEEVSMSKRSGEFITLDELLAEVGVDAARWFFARAPHDRHRLRHRAGQEAVGREPGLLRPVRARSDLLDPAQGGGRRASTPAAVAARRARRRPGRRGSRAGGVCDCRRSSRTPRRPRRRRA